MKHSARNYLVLWLTALVPVIFLGYYTRICLSPPWLPPGTDAIRAADALLIGRILAPLAFGVAAGITLVKVLSIGWQSVIARKWKVAWLCTIGLLVAWLMDHFWPLAVFRFGGLRWTWIITTYAYVTYNFRPMQIVAVLILLWKLARASRE